MSNVQTSYSFNPVVALQGMLGSVIDAQQVVQSRVASGLVHPGSGLLVGSSGSLAREPIDADALATSATTIIVTPFAAGTAAVTAATSSLDGSIGVAETWPPRPVEIVLNSHANWDVGTIMVRGLDWQGLPIEEVFMVPDAGAVTLTGKLYFSKVISFQVSPMSGTAATFTAGYVADYGPLNKNFDGVVVLQTTFKELDRTDNAVEDTHQFPMLKRGRIWVHSESTTAVGDQAHLRLKAHVAPNDVNGAWTATAEAGYTGPVIGARFLTAGTGAGLRELEIR